MKYKARITTQGRQITYILNASNEDSARVILARNYPDSILHSIIPLLKTKPHKEASMATPKKTKQNPTAPQATAEATTAPVAPVQLAPSREIRGFKFYFFPDGQKRMKFWPIIDEAVATVGLTEEEITQLVEDATQKGKEYAQGRAMGYFKSYSNREGFKVLDDKRLVKAN